MHETKIFVVALVMLFISVTLLNFVFYYNNEMSKYIIPRTTTIYNSDYYYTSINYETKQMEINQRNKANTSNNQHDEKYKIALLHIGKTGGTTVKQMLRLYNSCKPIPPYETKRQIKQRKNRCKKSNNNDNISNTFNKTNRISLYVKGIYHEIPLREEDIKNKNKYTSYIITIRHPIHRVISAYSYSNPRNYNTKITKDSIYKCYLTPNMFFTKGLSSSLSSIDEKDKGCKIFAVNALKGNVKAGCPHFYYNYNYYTEQILSMNNEAQHDIFLIRTEQFWQDWTSIHEYLGGNPNAILKIKPKTHYEKRNISKSANNRNISINGIRNACRILCNEIQIYKKLLMVGINLNDTDRLLSLKELNHTCPIETNASFCP